MKKLILFLLLTSMVMNFNVCFATNEKDLASIRDLVKDIHLPKDNLESLAVDMHMNLPLPMKIVVQLRHAKQDNYALYVFDGDDNTPILVVTGKKAMVNDPFADSVTIVASAGVAFDLSPQGESYNANFAFNMPTEGQIKNRVDMDFKTMFSRVCVDVTATQTAQNLTLFQGKTQQESACKALFSASGSYPLSSLSLFIKDSPEPILDFPLIKVDQKIDQNVFVFPMDEFISSGVSYVEMKSDGVIDTMMIVASVMRAVFSRAAIRNKPLRGDIEKSLKISPDWEKVEKSDAHRSELLRKIFVPLKD